MMGDEIRVIIPHELYDRLPEEWVQQARIEYEIEEAFSRIGSRAGVKIVPSFTYTED